MKEAMAVTGYVSPEELRVLGSKDAQRSVDVRPERDIAEVYSRVSLNDIAEVRSGAETKGSVLVQLILKPKAKVETITSLTSTVTGLRRFHDPVLDRVRALAAPKMIFVG